jgi:hypothetical protein
MQFKKNHTILSTCSIIASFFNPFSVVTTKIGIKYGQSPSDPPPFILRKHMI